MVAINTLFIRIKTGLDGTDGHVYVGIDGREFYIDSGEPDEDYNDFERGDDRTYICGEMPPLQPPNSTQIKTPSFHHPRKLYPLDTDNLDKSPVYLRFEPDHDQDTWRLNYVSVQVNPTPDRPFAMYEALDADDDKIQLALGKHFGKYVYLHKVASVNKQS
jgi:hypothetical protein